MTTYKLITEAELQQAIDALASSYQVCDYPANGNSPQDQALATLRAVQQRERPKLVAWRHPRYPKITTADKPLSDEWIDTYGGNSPLYVLPEPTP